MNSLLTGMAIGFFGSVHCVVMCGGIAGALSVAVPPARRTRASLTWQQLGFSAGRVTSYTVAGGVAGALGAAVAAITGAWGALALRAGAALLLMAVGLYLGGWSPVVTVLERQGARLWRYIAPLTRRLRPGDSVWVAAALGSLWGWLPCGLVYSALLLAATSGTALDGAGLMLGFGAGTVPAMVGVGLLAEQVNALLRAAWSRRLAGAVVIGFAAWTFAAGAFAAPRGATPTCHAQGAPAP